MNKILYLALFLVLGGCATTNDAGITTHPRFTDSPVYSMDTACMVWPPNLAPYAMDAFDFCFHSHNREMPNDFSIHDYKLCKKIPNKPDTYVFHLEFQCSNDAPAEY